MLARGQRLRNPDGIGNRWLTKVLTLKSAGKIKYWVISHEVTNESTMFMLSRQIYPFFKGALAPVSVSQRTKFGSYPQILPRRYSEVRSSGSRWMVFKKSLREMIQSTYRVLYKNRISQTSVQKGDSEQNASDLKFRGLNLEFPPFSMKITF